MPHDDFAFEPVKGLPERPPQDEEILWQGSPNWWALAKESLSLKWVAGYFIFLALWRFVVVVDIMPLGRAIQTSVPFLVLGAIACGILTLIAWVQAKATVYTITNKRVAMRIGAALTVTLNLPYRWIGNADLDLRKNGTGTIAMQTLGETRLSYLMCWPHVRPWRMAQTEPALRCIPDAAKVASLLAHAADARVSVPEVSRAPDHHAVAAE
ncbi:photosynthetic complex putative assembly protein PuhB [Parasulfitobacter algicola]|uniref:PH domain-containing protein n=1 Tax=Parasulfitobacter algicola TaxID=2614809 RepID=A0ABX2IQS6_9RHOB|nr:photosynthetic complex putative assembly protein PuhB [Sulfitobacter algicola]NSX53455.1 PH domain-containing protein [Sulfitobacter algicola]